MNTSDFRRDLATAINRASAENASGTPDHILAAYLSDSLDAFDRAVAARAEWRAESTELPALIALRQEQPHD